MPELLNASLSREVDVACPFACLDTRCETTLA
jgi:hypothetical protein